MMLEVSSRCFMMAEVPLETTSGGGEMRGLPDTSKSCRLVKTIRLVGIMCMRFLASFSDSKETS